MIKSVAPPERILIVALDNLGDLVFASALAEPLRAAFPNAAIDVWCKTYTAAVARLIPFTRAVIAADTFWAVPPHLARPKPWPFLRSAGEVRRNRYDMALLTGAPWRTAAAVATTRIPIRIGLARNHNAHFLTHTLDAEDGHKPVLLEQARLLAPLGVTSARPRYQLDTARLAAERTAIAAQLPLRFVSLHPFASRRSRCVPLPVWTQLAFALQDRGMPCLWVGTAAELDELRGAYAHPRGAYVDQLGNASLAASTAALSLASAFVGHDSGPLHISAAFGVAAVGVFAPGQPDRTFPQGVGASRVIHRATPAEITSDMMLRELEALGLFSAS